MSDSHEPAALDRAAVHALGNQVGIILGFIEIILSDTPDDDPRRPDLMEVRSAARSAALILGAPPTADDRK